MSNSQGYISFITVIYGNLSHLCKDNNTASSKKLIAAKAILMVKRWYCWTSNQELHAKDFNVFIKLGKIQLTFFLGQAKI